MKLRCVIWFLCLFLFVAAADTIPDPPALNPSGGGTVILTQHFRSPATNTSLESESLLESRFAGPVELASPSSRLDVDEFILHGSLIPLVRLAADPSPPTLN